MKQAQTVEGTQHEKVHMKVIFNHSFCSHCSGEPDSRPATEARSTGPILGVEPTGQEKYQSGQEELHT